MNLHTTLTQSLKSATAGAALLLLTSGIAVALSPTSAIAQDHGGGNNKGGHESGDEGDSCGGRGGCGDSGHDSGEHESGGQGRRGGHGRAPGEASGAQSDRSIEDIFREAPSTESGPPAAKGQDGSDDKSHSQSDKSTTAGPSEASAQSDHTGDR